MTPSETASDAVMSLIYHGIIRNNRETLAKIEKLTGIGRADLEASKRRLAKTVYRPIDVHQAERSGGLPPQPRRVTPSRETAPRPAGMRKGPVERDRRQNAQGGTELFCSGHDGHAAHWAPEEEFLPRADRPHLRHVYCDEGRKSYLRARRVTTKVLDELSSAGFGLTLDEDSNLLGIVCKECGQPFAAGDDIEGDAVMRHALCPVRTDEVER